jgi:hypothetical protein
MVRRRNAHSGIHRQEVGCLVPSFTGELRTRFGAKITLWASGAKIFRNTVCDWSHLHRLITPPRWLICVVILLNL